MSEELLPGLPDDDMSFHFRRKSVSKELQESNWKKVKEVIASEAPVRKINWFKTVGIAASLLCIIATAAWFFTMRTADAGSSSEYKTGFAKIKKITLPDGSRVTLNANSELKLSADWSETGDRQVWLEGEAYFEVEKKPATHQKFIVHTKDVDVEVLGTKFNVNTRHQKSLVSLEEGKIKLSVKGETKTVLQQQNHNDLIEMHPGELMVLDTAVAVTEDAHINFHSGWVRNEFHFNNTSLKEIGTMISDIYGYTLVTEDESLMKRTISGDLRANNLNELIDVLRIAFKLKMTITNKSIEISHL